MSLRESVRRLRLYYKSGAVVRECLRNPGVARWLPFMPGNTEVELQFTTGRSAKLRARHWSLLPSACRLDRIGAQFEFLEDAKRVRVDGLELYSPLWSREEASYYKEVLLDDAYGVNSRDLSGKTVVDVGAYVGDSTLAFARRGATVHAFEPSVAFCGFIRRNLQANAMADRVRLHEVGLAEKEQVVPIRNDRLHLVEGVSYVLENLPRDIELLKLDCEGAEYHLLADPRFLEHLRPAEIRMEYHRGPEPILAHLKASGYAARQLSGPGPVGLISAQRNPTPTEQP